LMNKSESRLALRIVLLYVLLAGLLDVVSDQVLALFNFEPGWFFDTVVAKDSAFVLLTAVLLYWLVRRELKRLKLAEAERRASDVRLLNILDVDPDAIIATDVGQRILLLNKSAERIFGYSAGQVLGRSLDLLLPKQRLEEWLQSVPDLANTSGLVRTAAEPLTVSGQRKDGSEFPAEVSLSASAQNGQTTFTFVLRDITRRTQAREALRESEERYRSMITAMQEGIIFQDAEGVILTCNASAERMLGLSADQMMGRTSLDPRWQTIHEDGSPFPSETRPAMVTLRTGQPLSNVVMGVYKPDGALTWLSVNSQPLFRAGESSPYGVVVTFADITDRRQAELAVRESEARYRALVDSSIDGILLTAPDGRIFAANAAACEILGRTEEEIRQAGRDGVVDPSDPRLAVALEGRARTGKFRSELFLISKNGTRFPCEVSSSVFKGEGGQVRTSMIIRDITERKRVEEALRLANAYNRSLIEASLDPLVTIGPDGKVTDVNTATEHVTGRSRQDLIGTDFSDYFTEPGKARAGYQQVFREGLVRDYELGLLHRDGHVTSVLYNASVYRDEAGQVVGVFAAARDITDRRRAEQAVSQLAAIVESSDDAITSTTLDGIVVSWNAGAERLYGYAAAEIIGRSVSMLLPPERHDELTRLLDRVGRGESTRHLETTRRAKDGRNVDVSLTVSPTRNAQGQIVGASTIARDITERVQAYQLLERRVEERTRELTTLLEISHTVASTLELKPLLRLIFDQLKSVMNYTSAAIFTLEDEELVLVEYEAPVPQRPAQPLRLPLEQAGAGLDVIRCREPVIVGDVKGDIPLAQALRGVTVGDVKAIFGYARSWMAIPIMSKDRVIGMLSLTYGEPNHYTPHHASLAQTIANQAAIAIENAKLYEEAQQVAALQERQRLARELHDAVTQTLFSASLIAEVLPRLWENDQAEGREYLEDLRRLTRGALAEMRAMLLELRPSALNESDLGDLLRQLADAIAGRSRLSVAVDIQARRSLPSDVKVALYRVAQEALNNVAKHSKANCVTIGLQDVVPIQEGYSAGGVELYVSDDGQGFDRAPTSPEHFGLGIMRERSDAIGATLDIESKPGQGTRVTIVWRAAPSGDVGKE
jgi:PAS domain S-box-containing protein